MTKSLLSAIIVAELENETDKTMKTPSNPVYGKALLYILLLSGLNGLIAAETISEISSPGWTDTGEDNGWQYDSLDESCYPDGAVKFDKSGAKISSPVFAGDILKIEIDVKSSNSEPPRKLTLSLYSGSECKSAININPTAKPESEGYQTFEIDGELDVDRFTIELSSGAWGNWGVYSIRTHVSENKVLGAYTLKTRSTGFTARWTNANSVVSNEIIVTTIKHLPLTINYESFFDFSQITNTSGNTHSVMDQVNELYPQLEGFEVNLPSRAAGYVMLGKSNQFGAFSLESSPVNEGKSLVFEAERFNENDEGWIMPIYYAVEDKTNLLSSVSLEKTPQKKLYWVDLDTVPASAKLIVHSVTNKATQSRANARTKIYSLGLADSIEPAHSETNTAARLFAVGRESARINGLIPESEYFWSIRGFDDNGGASKFVDLIKTKTEPHIGFGISVK